MRKNLSKVVSLMLTVCFLFSIIPMTSVFAAPSGYTAPILSEKFDSVWPVGTALEIPTEAGEVDFYNGWKLKTTTNGVVNTTMSVKNVDGVGNVLSFKKSAYTESQSGESDYRFLKKPLAFDEETDIATIEFKVRRMEIDTIALILQFNETDFFSIRLRTADILYRTSSSNPGFKGGMTQEPADTWHSFLVKLDYSKRIMDIYVNGTRMTPYSDVRSATAYEDGNMPLSTALKQGVTKSFPDFALGIRAIQNNTGKDAEIQLTDIVVNEYSNEQIAAEEAAKAQAAVDKAIAAVDQRFACLNGTQIAENMGDSLVNGSALNAVLAETGATLTWSSGNTALLAADGTITARPASATDVTLTATVEYGGKSAQRSYTVTVLSEYTGLYETFENYFSDAATLSSWNSMSVTDNNNMTVSIVPEAANTTNNVINIQGVTDSAASDYDITNLTGLKWGGSVGSGNACSEISFKLARGNEDTKKINVRFQNTTYRRVAFSFDLMTGQVTFPEVHLSSSSNNIDKRIVAVPAYPAGSTLYIQDLIDEPLAVGEWLDVNIKFTYLGSEKKSKTLIYVNGRPLVYGSDVTADGVSVLAGQPMLPHGYAEYTYEKGGETNSASAWPNNTIKEMIFSLDPSDDATSADKIASFLIDDIKMGYLTDDEVTCLRNITNVINPEIDRYSSSISSAVFNTEYALPVPRVNGMTVKWEAAADNIVQNNKVVLTDGNALTQTTLTVTLTLGDAVLTNSWDVKVAPRLMAKVTGVAIDGGMLKSITMDNLCVLPANSKLLIGVYDSTTNLYKNFKLIDVTDEGTIVLDTPLAVGANDTVKAFIWNINAMNPMAASFAN